MDNYRLPENLPDTDNSLEKQLAQSSALTRAEFDEAEKIIGFKLQSAMNSLQQSASNIKLLLAAQNPADRNAPAAMALQHDLESLLASGNHLEQLALLLQKNFTGDHEAGQKRTECEIAKVLDAIAQHRTSVQDNAIALTEAALNKARARDPSGHVINTNRRTAR